jgi:hypothetical protein
MAIISMAVYDTEENKRSELTKQTINSLLLTTDLDKHTLVVIDNNSCAETKEYLKLTQNS